ncbi:MAG: hypothetical protein HN416_10115 [Nitrospina sp.]|nr:hypothetical protein [Nitrospina sp.]
MGPGKWLTAVQDSDPGRIRLKQAVRTTLSAFVTVCALSLLSRYWPLLSGMTPILMGAMSATLASQILNGETRGQQQAATLSAGFCGIAMVLLTWAVRETPLLNGITMSLLAFAVFYIRRFGLLYVGLGLYTLFIYMFGTIVAKTEISPLPAAAAIFLSIPLTYIVSFHFLPGNRRYFFRDNVLLFIDQSRRLVTILNKALSGRVSTASAEKETHEALRELQKRLSDSETTLSGIDSEDENERRLLENIYLNEYRIYGALSLAIDAVLEVVRLDGADAGPRRREMEEIFHLLETLLRTAKRRSTEANPWHSQLDRYRRLVNTAKSDLAAGVEIRKGRAFFLVRILLAMDRVGGSLSELHDDLMGFEDQVGP